MYKPSQYKKEDPEYVLQFIKAHPFATFVLQSERLLATHIPVLTKGSADDFFLFGHVAVHNPQRECLKDEMEVLLIFQGPDAYISSSWYRKPDISTWDYSAVHINARLKIQREEELRESLKELVAHFESKQTKPVYYEDIPKEILESHLPKITGFWLYPSRVDAIAKLSQNKSAEDVASVVAHLKQKTCPAQSELIYQIQKEND
ncbi:FMN-binding negative transcriptional regulator [Catalinimonas niigatensis]|uniref:FMN-binding negative transcriptional regulator n=1 Tax=Catalinimonas niigatensis TaxID=1397264 RepID=UPI002666A1AB|nr:FMN-binding negative transcriptional regulator [Catalinimonas niigatensis]WPP50763.1 FMN-binding negative transcriptional regulator [Catalinimonas niigatensis]